MALKWLASRLHLCHFCKTRITQLNNSKCSYLHLDKARGKIRSNKGGWIIGKGVYSHGYDINKDCVGHLSYFQLLILHATNKLPERRVADWLEAAYMGLSWPDSRIWCNQVAAFAGSMKTAETPSLCAGLLAADTKLYAQKSLLEGVNFISRALIDHKKGRSVLEIVEQECAKYRGRPIIAGYARPVANGDERIAPLEAFSKKLGFEKGEHLTLAYSIEKELKNKFNEEMNMNGYVSAFLADQGYSNIEAYRICVLCTASGILACHLNSYERPPETFLPLRCEDIEYQGPPLREVPDRD